MSKSITMPKKAKIRVKSKKKADKKKTIVKSTSRETIFKVWCQKNEITQSDIMVATKISAGCVHHLWNDGTASKSTIHHLSLVYSIDEVDLEKMIITFNDDLKATSKILNNLKVAKK
jgi:hypothetical protein